MLHACREQNRAPPPPTRNSLVRQLDSDEHKRFLHRKLVQVRNEMSQMSVPNGGGFGGDHGGDGDNDRDDDGSGSEEPEGYVPQWEQPRHSSPAARWRRKHGVRTRHLRSSRSVPYAQRKARRTREAFIDKTIMIYGGGFDDDGDDEAPPSSLTPTLSHYSRRHRHYHPQRHQRPASAMGGRQAEKAVPQRPRSAVKAR